LTSASALSATTLTSDASWWERVTVTVTDDGQPQSCHYESSLQPNDAQSCDVDSSQAGMAKLASSKDEYTRITFERRFSPGAKVAAQTLQPGETLLGGQVMALAIDARGAVKNCRIVATTGAVSPQYGCDEVAAERFDASVTSGKSGAPAREGFLSVIVYGHSEHVV
jgi:hypothetical protein